MVRHLFIGSALALAVSGAWAQGQVNVICSVQAEWCNLMSTVYTKTTGTKVLSNHGDVYAKDCKL